MNPFIEKVSKMRQLQKRYFRERSNIVLQQCKAAERDVDMEIERATEVNKTEQLSMFKQ